MTQEIPPPGDGPPAPTDVFNRSDERSVLNLVPPSLQESFLLAHKAIPDLFGLDEQALFKWLRTNNHTPTATDNRLRMAFWVEYDRAQAHMTRMNMSYVLGGVCTSNYFYNHYLKLPHKLVWLLCPPAAYATVLEEGVAYGAALMRSYLEIDPREGGKLNTKLMELQAKIFAMLDQRMKGGYTQNVVSKSLSLTGTVSEKQALQALQDNSMEALDKKMRELERQERKSSNMPSEPQPVIDVTPDPEPT